MSFTKRTLSLILAALALAAQPALAKDYLLAGTKPNKLHLIDAAARQVVKTLDIPSAPGPGPQVIVPSPDGKRAYVVTNRWESVSGLDLDSGKEVFRTNLSRGDERVKVPFGLAISPDGKELYVYESPVKLGLGEYQVQDTRIAVFDTAAGLDARPVRSFKAPRRIIMLMTSADGQLLYGLGWDLYAFDPKSGELKETLPIRNWQRPNYAEPDVLDAWPQFEQSGIFSTPYFAARTDKDPSDPEAYKVGILTLDLKTGDFAYKDFENLAVVIFSSVVNPVKPREIYAVYTQLSKIDLGAGPETGALLKRIDLPHTYYAINISADGQELYVGGAMNDIGVYSTQTLERIGEIKLPGGGDQALASLRVVRR
ncbi:MAG TPA: quinohemoprotein amine dehydrogenase subunit beta [Candidatus Competibacteraceae bacterium]|nr:quinohemoprotein amine dehydrogenase subunit beta [Candidatus Competibacteraceae bacterium]